MASTFFLMHCDFGLGVRVERVDADYRVDSGFLDILDVLEKVGAAFVDQLNIFLFVNRIQRFARRNRRAAAMALESSNRGNNNCAIAASVRKSGI